MAAADETYEDFCISSPSRLNEVVCQLGVSQASRAHDQWKLRVEHEFGSEVRRKTQVSTHWKRKVVIVATGEVEEITHALQCPAFPFVSLLIITWPDCCSSWDDELLSHMDSISSVLASSPFQSFSLSYLLRDDRHVKKSSQSFGPTLQALSKNSSLKELRLDVDVRLLIYADKGAEWRRRPRVLRIEEDGPSSALIQHFVHNQSCTLPALHLPLWPFTDSELSNLASALAANTTPPTLHTLHISFDAYDFSNPAKPVLAVIKALESNTTITSFTIRKPSSYYLTYLAAKDLQKVYEALIDLLSVNFTLKHVDLDNSGLEENEERMSTIRGMLQSSGQDPKAVEALTVLQNVPRVQPTSARVFFCGYGYAGKTTLQKTMVRSFNNHNLIRKAIHLGNMDEQVKRTSGIEVTCLNTSDVDIFFWDLAGQREYHAFHDLMFPKEQGPSLFLIICSLINNVPGQAPTRASIKSLECILAELRYWLRYISSNTRKTTQRMPRVSFIFTHEDKIGSSVAIKIQVESLTKELEQEFESRAKVVGVFFVDGRKLNAVHSILAHTVNEVKEIVTSSQYSVHVVCNKGKRLLAEWIKDHPNKPWMNEEQFRKLCIKEFYKLEGISYGLPRSEAAEIAKAVLFDLHRTGSLIHFNHQDIVLVNLQWFCKDFMGRILEQSIGSSLGNRKLGVWKRREIDSILESVGNADQLSREKTGKILSLKKATKEQEHHLDGEQLIRIMIQLEFCFEIDCGANIFIPATLRESRWQAHRRWTAEVGKRECGFGYVGRRLDCEDEKHTFLTPGFFPRLQVHLNNAIKVMQYELERDLIKIVDDRMEVLIEFNEAPTSFVDIMVRFPKSKSLDHVLDFLGERIIRNIRLLQQTSGCWQGVFLIEKALRPSCVEQLMLPEIKLKQCVLLEELATLVHRSNLVDDIFNITYAWGSMAEATGVGEEYTPIIELVGERCFMGIVSERLVKVEELGKQLGIDRGKASHTWGSESASTGLTESNRDILPECSSQSQRDIGGVYAGLDSRLQRIEAQMDVMAQDIKGMSGAIGKLINGMRPEVDRLLTELHNLNSAHDRGGNSALPQLFVLDREKTLLSRLVPGLVESSRLTFMCESSPHMPHLMLGQEGIAVSTLGEGAVRSILPYMRVMLRVLALGLEVGAPMARANAIMVPNLSKLIDDLIGKCRGILERSELFPGNIAGGRKNIMQGLDEVVLADARTWVQEFMREKGCDTDSQITKRFGLRKKRLRDGRCVWLCEDHYRHAL